MEIYCPAKQVGVFVSGGGGGEGSGASWCEDVHSGEDPHSKSPSYDLVHVNVLCFTEEVFLKVDFYNDSRNNPPPPNLIARQSELFFCLALHFPVLQTTQPGQLGGVSQTGWRLSRINCPRTTTRYLSQPLYPYFSRNCWI